ncbi:hypothetical protein IWW52_004151, partial [Coemansia sp. RSA 2704]
MTNAAGATSMTDAAGVTNAASTTNMTDMAGATNAASMTNMTNAAGATNVASTTSATSATNTTDTAGATNAASTTNTADTAGATNAADAAGVTDATSVTDAAGATSATNTTSMASIMCPSQRTHTRRKQRQLKFHCQKLRELAKREINQQLEATVDRPKRRELEQLCRPLVGNSQQAAAARQRLFSVDKLPPWVLHALADNFVFVDPGARGLLCALHGNSSPQLPAILSYSYQQLAYWRKQACQAGPPVADLGTEGCPLAVNEALIKLSEQAVPHPASLAELAADAVAR